MKKVLYAGLALTLALPAFAKTPLNLLDSKANIAIVCDGNSPDPDDIAGIAFSLGLMKAAGKAYKVKHVSYNCHLEWEKHPTVKYSTTKKNFIKNTRMPEMKTTIDSTMSKWGGYSTISPIDCQLRGSKPTNPRGTVAMTDLSKVIHASSSTSKLYIIHQGEADVIWSALNRAKKHSTLGNGSDSKLKNVIIISHGDENDAGDYHSMTDILRDFPVQQIKIPSQNEHLQTKDDLTPWNWAKWSWRPAKIKYLYNRLEYVATETDIITWQKDNGDCSDAGLVAYFLTGKDDINPTQMKDLITGAF